MFCAVDFSIRLLPASDGTELIGEALSLTDPFGPAIHHDLAKKRMSHARGVGDGALGPDSEGTIMQKPTDILDTDALDHHPVSVTTF